MAEVLPEAVYSVAQVRNIDRFAIERLGIAGYRLMTRAAEAALTYIDVEWPDAPAAVYCGAGNNAGDGYVLARLAAERGRAVRVVAVVPPDRLVGDAARACRDCVAAGVVIEPFDAAAPELSADTGIVVDALLGTGLTRALEGPIAAAVDAINAGGRPVVALDLPTGIGADTGVVHGRAVQADLTVTFVGLKQGLFLGDAPNYLGRLEFSDLGIPAQAYAGCVPGMRRLTRRAFDGVLGRRPRTAHKGTNGRLLMVGGGPGMGGAIRLAAEAAARVGAGLIHVATHPDNVATVMAGRPELICRGCEAGGIPDDWLDGADTIVIGPGLGRDDWGRAALARVRGRAQPVVADADALNLLASAPFELGDWVLTPHPGEAARLLGAEPAAIQRDRLDSIRQLAARFDATVVLKGAGTLVATARHPADVAICDRGNPGMATAGMGDVLAGVIGALRAQGADSSTAARAGVLLHALAGDAAAAGGGERGLLAADLFPELRRLANPA